MRHAVFSFRVRPNNTNPVLNRIHNFLLTLGGRASVAARAKGEVLTLPSCSDAEFTLAGTASVKQT